MSWRPSFSLTAAAVACVLVASALNGAVASFAAMFPPWADSLGRTG
jgi:hypothetical protein